MMRKSNVFGEFPRADEVYTIFAAFIFKKLGMHKTELRNGILFYLAVNDQKFAILGDAGINAKVPENFWNEIKEHMLLHFKKEEFAEGLSPLGNATAADCADYCVVMFSDLTKKVTMQNLLHDGGFSSMSMSETVIEDYRKGLAANE